MMKSYTRKLGWMISVSFSCLLAFASVCAYAKPNDDISKKPAYTQISKAPFGEYTMDKTHGYITFSYLHQGYSRPWLRFRGIDATLDIAKSDIEKSKISVVVDASSIDSGVDVFDEHLRDKKFFDVEAFPTITFESSDVMVDEKGAMTIVGDLTIKGITKPVQLDAVFNKGGRHFKTGRPLLGFSATTQLKRSEWGLGYGVPIVGNVVDVVIEVEFNKQ